MLLARIRPGFLRGRSHARIGRAQFDPGHEVGDLAVRKLLAFRRHLQIGIGVADGFDEHTFFRIAGNDHRAVLAAFEQAFVGIEQQAAFDLLGLLAVAFVAVVGEEWADFVFEELDLGGSRFGTSYRETREQQEGKDLQAEV